MAVLFFRALGIGGPKDERDMENETREREMPWYEYS